METPRPVSFPPPDPVHSGRHAVWIPMLMGGLVVALCLPSYFQQDDFSLFWWLRYEKPSPANWFEVWPMGLWRPFHLATLWVETRLFGADPIGYRLAHGILYLASIFLFHRLAIRLLSSRAAAFFAACLFASAFSHWEAAQWICASSELWVGFFGLVMWTALLEYAARPKLVWLAAAIGAHILALLTKENAVVLLPLAGLILVWRGRWWDRSDLNLKGVGSPSPPSPTKQHGGGRSGKGPGTQGVALGYRISHLRCFTTTAGDQTGSPLRTATGDHGESPPRTTTTNNAGLGTPSSHNTTTETNQSPTAAPRILRREWFKILLLAGPWVLSLIGHAQIAARGEAVNSGVYSLFGLHWPENLSAYLLRIFTGWYYQPNAPAAAAVILLFGFGVVVFLGRKRWSLLFPLLWILCALLPYLGLDLPRVYPSRYAYVASMGGALFVAELLWGMIRWFPRNAKMVSIMMWLICLFNIGMYWFHPEIRYWQRHDAFHRSVVTALRQANLPPVQSVAVTGLVLPDQPDPAAFFQYLSALAGPPPRTVSWGPGPWPQTPDAVLSWREGRFEAIAP